MIRGRAGACTGCLTGRLQPAGGGSRHRWILNSRGRLVANLDLSSRGGVPVGHGNYADAGDAAPKRHRALEDTVDCMDPSSGNANDGVLRLNVAEHLDLSHIHRGTVYRRDDRKMRRRTL